MSTVVKGDALEDETFILLKKELEAGRLGMLLHLGEFLRKKDITREIERRISWLIFQLRSGYPMQTTTPCFGFVNVKIMVVVCQLTMRKNSSQSWTK